MEAKVDDYFPCADAHDCPYLNTGCHEDIHHEYWPRSDYLSSSTEKQFWKANKIQVCRRLHEYIHAHMNPPTKPSHEEMRANLEERRGEG